jgi:hypothetical protein
MEYSPLMNTEAILKIGEGEMKNGKWAGALVAAIAALGMAQFGYALFRQVGDWPLSLIASSASRLVAADLENCGVTCWLAPLALVATGLLAAAATAWRARIATGPRKVDNHE